MNRRRAIAIMLVMLSVLCGIASVTSANETLSISAGDSPLSNDTREGTIIRYLKLRVMLDNSYRSDYSNPYTVAANTLVYLDYPFASIWGIRFVKSYVDIAPLPIDSCSISYSTQCNDSCCGSNSNRKCNNNTYNMIHHKNIYKNLKKISSDISSSGYDIMLTMTSAAMCGVSNGVHKDVIWGLAYLNGKYALTYNASSLNDILKLRIIQHEISHLFGCLDNQCTSGAKCIMNGGWDTTSPNSYNNIWCPNCMARFNPNAH